MQLKVKLLVGDDNLKLLEGLLNFLPPVSGLDEPSPSTDSSFHGSIQLPEAGDSRNSSSNDARDESTFDTQISIKLVVIRKELLSAIANIAKGGENDGPANGFEVYGLVPSPSAKPRLTPREKDVILLVAGGMATKEVAFALNISPKTVDFHRDNVKKKIGLRSAAHLTRYAMENGWA